MEDSPSLRFGRFELQPRQLRLMQDGEPVALGARPLTLLMALVGRRERIVTKAELLELAWPGLVVEENNLQVQVSMLRKLLGAQVITTIPGRGYRFTAPLDTGPDGNPRADQPRPAHPVKSVDAAGPLTNLPVTLPRLYGREVELAELRTLIEAHRLVTVVGAGGIGKSRLA